MNNKFFEISLHSFISGNQRSRHNDFFVLDDGRDCRSVVCGDSTAAAAGGRGRTAGRRSQGEQSWFFFCLEEAEAGGTRSVFGPDVGPMCSAQGSTRGHKSPVAGAADEERRKSSNPTGPVGPNV